MESVTIGPCTLYCGDALEAFTLIGGVDAVICDPPYGISLQNHCAGQCWDGSRRQGRTPLDWMISGDESHAVADAIRQWCAESKTPVAMFGSAYKPYAGNWRNILVWNKGPAVGGGGDPSKCWKRTHELIYIADNGPLRGARDGSVIDWPVTPTDFEHHPAQKPVGLLAYIVEQMTDEGGVVCDPTMGSGSTMLACIRTSRRGIGIELTPERFDIACSRVKDAWRLKKSELPFEKPPVEVQRELIPA